ncbi:MAG: hypothetical protein U9O85_07710 [Euryarchaeota archaeon]|nr:hypothetical protein [Euryarchaeota archaeon]
MKSTPLNIALRIVISILTFIIVTFFVAGLLEDVIYFSLFIGIPAGIISAIIAFAIMTWCQAKNRKLLYTGKLTCGLYILSYMKFPRTPKRG